MIGKRLSTFRRGFLSTFSLDVVARAMSALATVIFIRALDVGSFAYLVLFLNIGQFAGSALTGGIRMRYLRAEAERVSRGEERATGFAMALAAGLALVLGVATLAVAGLAVAEGAGSGAGAWLFVALAAAFTAGHASIELAMYHNQAHLRFTRAGVLGVARSGAIFAIAIATLHGLVDGGAAVAAAIAAAVLAVAAAVCLPLVRQAITAPAAAALGASFGREAGWLTVYYLASAGFAYADILVVASFLDDEAVASYGAALRYVAIVLGPMPALLAVLRVRTSQHDIVDSAQRQAGMIADWIRRAILPVGAAIGITALAAPLFIPLLDGNRYPDSVPIFQLLLLPALVNYTTMPGPNLLMAQKRYRLLALVYAIALAAQVVLAGTAATLSGAIAVAAVAATVGSLEAGAVAVLAARIAKRGPGAAERGEPAAGAGP
jgi:O-antigen/teichoic acid export membrane protein